MRAGNVTDVAETAEHGTLPEPEPGRTIVVMPALNAAKTLELIVGSIPRDIVDEVILVDDRSTDETLEIAEAQCQRRLAPAQRRLRRQPEDLLPRGAPARGRDRRDAPPGRPVRARVDPAADRAHSAGEADLVLGSRMMIPGAAKEAGMPLYKRVANRGLTTSRTAYWARG